MQRTACVLAALTATALGCAAENVTQPSSAVASLLAVGDFHTCAVRSSPGAASCWGNNFYGRLGDATTVLRPSRHGRSRRFSN